MTLKAKSLSKNAIVIHGVSHIEYNLEGLISFQRDYFDSTELFYKNIPILGSIIRYIEKKIKND